MIRFLRQLPYPPLIFAVLLLGLAPFRPQPHLLEKLVMLSHGELTRPVDIFDLVFHAAPAILLLLKLIFGRSP